MTSPVLRYSLLALSASTSLVAAGPSAIADQPKDPRTVKNFGLGDVQLLDSPFKQAMERNATYLLSLNADRLLHNTREYAGLKAKGELYGGWEAKGIAGHTLGHYLTAISQQYAATGDKRFLDRINYIVSEMAECQKAYGDGYVGALPPKELETLRAMKDGKLEVSSPFNFKGGAWVPWYTQHKILAGLKDAWVLGKNKQAKEVTLKLADWVDTVTAGLTPEQQQDMLRVEHGGMLETLTEIYQLTKEPRYLATAKRFYQKSIFDPLLAGKDALTGLHANTQIPKIIGEARSYEVTGDEGGKTVSEFFWNTVVHNRSWVIGGNSDREHFFPVGKSHEHLGPLTAESCNTYNMLKLTEHLFTWQPRVELADYYERALYNQILGSQEPEHGQFAYFISMKPGHTKVFSTPEDSFWCCSGSGMENHTKYGEAIYFHDDSRLFVNLFLPSTLNWKENGLALIQNTSYPRQDFTELSIRTAPQKELTIAVRCPAFATAPVTFMLNGQPLSIQGKPGTYAEIKRIWKKGDTLRATIPMGLHIEKLDGNEKLVAFLYGPLVLAGDFGPAPRTKTFPLAKDQGDNQRAATVPVPVLVRKDDSTDLLASLQRLPGDDIAFKTQGLGQPDDVTLRPINGIFYDYYNIYWNVFTAAEWAQKKADILKKEEAAKREEARIVDALAPGEQQSEVDHQATSSESTVSDFRNRKARSIGNGGWFEYSLKVLPDTAQLLRFAYWGDEPDSGAVILIDGQPLVTQTLTKLKPGQFVDIDTPIPAALLKGKSKITIRIQALPGKQPARFFASSILKAEK